ncbi:MAG: DNA polymerase III subunit delta [Verrucomicrobia bacterium]|nr:DNA polymerase III subunit delta [Verrucomicrobiota bacterium]
MPAATVTKPVCLVHGEDDLAVKARAKEIFAQWSAELGGMDHEIVDAQAGNSDEALRALNKLREALQTLPFFGGGKAIWFRDCTFLAEDRTSESGAVSDGLADLAQLLKDFTWENVRLLVSATKVDKRKTFYKTLEKLGAVETFASWSDDDKEWTGKAEMAALKQLRELKKEISDEALALLITYVGPNPRQLASEVEKLSLYAGDRPAVAAAEVELLVSRNKSAAAFALGDAVGDRNLPRVLRTLDSELWEMSFDKKKSEIGLTYGLITKVRAMLFAKELARAGLLKGEFNEYGYNTFKAQLQKIPADTMPEDKKFSPLGLNPYVLFRAYLQSKNYTTGELVRAMESLLKCNLALVSSGADETLVLQQTLVQIVKRDGAVTAPARS